MVLTPTLLTFALLIQRNVQVDINAIESGNAFLSSGSDLYSEYSDILLGNERRDELCKSDRVEEEQFYDLSNDARRYIINQRYVAASRCFSYIAERMEGIRTTPLAERANRNANLFGQLANPIIEKSVNKSMCQSDVYLGSVPSMRVQIGEHCGLMILDSGATFSAFRIKEESLSDRHNVMGRDALGISHSVEVVSIPVIQVGDHTLRNTPATYSDEVSATLRDIKVDGLLGLSVFYHFDLYLTQEGENSDAHVMLAAPNSSEILEDNYDNSAPLSYDGSSVRALVEIKGASYLCKIDTGSSRTYLPEEAVRASGGYNTQDTTLTRKTTTIGSGSVDVEVAPGKTMIDIGGALLDVNAPFVSANEECIIGWDVLSTEEIVLSVRNNLLGIR